MDTFCPTFDILATMRAFFSLKLLKRIDWRLVMVMGALMGVSLLVISSTTQTGEGEERFLTPMVRGQIQWFVIGWGVFFCLTALDYQKIREWTWGIYLVVILLLIGLFFADPIQRVQRWYRIPFIGMSLQPSEYAKLAVVISLSWYLERRARLSKEWSTAFSASVIVGIPFLLILKQPDLGTALVLFPITLVMFYFGGIRPSIIRLMCVGGSLLLLLVALIFSGIVSHEEIRPYATKVLKDYQFDRLDPETHHQRAASTAIALGGVTGTGWKKSEYTRHGWLPAPSTDSVFPAFGEEFGLIGQLVLLALFYALIVFSFQVTAVAKDLFGRLLSAGLTVYLAMHILVNIGMMTGLLPITGVPLVLVTYGGSSILSSMMALGVLQSIYCRRFMF